VRILYDFVLFGGDLSTYISCERWCDDGWLMIYTYLHDDGGLPFPCYVLFYFMLAIAVLDDGLVMGYLSIYLSNLI
jgi:hypothetical protein